jgi:GT2 family glycosyltransferase
MNLHKLLSVAGFRPQSLEAPNAWVGHLPFAAWLIKEVNPKIFVELGTHSGNSYFAFCQSIQQSRLQTKSYAVDTWQGDEHAGGYTDEVYVAVSTHNDRHYRAFSRLLRTTFDEAAGYFSDGSVDLLHIDGLHTYDAVRHDYEHWLPKLAPGAVVLFHDINVRERDFGVWKLWEELQQEHPNNIAFSHSNGLGVLQLNNATPDNKIEWMNPAMPERLEFTDFFAALGARQLERFDAQELAKQLVNRDELAALLRKDIAQKDAAIVELQAAIASLQGAVGEKDAQIAFHVQSCQDRDAQLDALRQSTREATEALSSKLAEKHRLACDLSEQLSHYKAEVDAHSIALTNAFEQIRQRDHDISTLVASSSWRLTSPIRSVGKQVKRVARVARLAGPAIQRGGGVTRTAKKAIGFYRRDGIAGLRRGLQLAANPGTLIPLPEPRAFDRHDYQEWIARFDTLTDTQRADLRKRSADFAIQPVISILLPTYNSPAQYLDEAIRSVRNQLYPHWQLCIADDASTKPDVRTTIQRHADQDARIRVVYRATNGHISNASNSALELAEGEFTALLDHDDLMAEHALFWIVEAINRVPDAWLVYSDEDKITEGGQRYDPYFKSDLNYELLLAQNMVCHLGAYRTSLLKQIGGFRTGFEGAQDYDLALRVIETLRPGQIIHIPRILYHWRAISGSTALGAGEKNYAAEAGRRAVSEHLQRRGIEAEVVPAPEAPALNRVRFACPSPQPKVSIIIPTRDRADLLQMCLDSIALKSTYRNYEVIIIDNGSVEDATHALFASLPKDRFKVLRDESPFNFSALNNMAVRASSGELVCLMNNDIEIITPDWLEEMVAFAMQPDVGCVGSRLWYPDGRLQHGGCVLGIGGICGHSHKYLPKGETGYFGRAVLHQSFSAVTAACLVIRRTVFDEVSGLDEKLVVAFNDVDFCLRVREAGYRNVWTPYAEMTHHESASRGLEDTIAKQNRFLGEIDFIKSRWGADLLVDPAYSPNLSLEIEDFSYGWPSRVT